MSGYDRKGDYASYMGGASDFSHARMAKGLVDQKRAAKAAKLRGDAPPGDEQAELDGETTVAEAGEGDMGEASEEPAMGAGMQTVEVTPEELAMLEEMRAAKVGA